MITSKALARKIFAPILATLMVAGLSTGLASPAKAAGTKQVIFHYQDPAATSFDDYKNLDFYFWGGASGDFAPNSSDSFGKVLTLNVDAATTGMDGLIKYGWTDVWGNKVACSGCTSYQNAADRHYTLNESGTTELWIVKGVNSAAFSSRADAVTAGALNAHSAWSAGAVDPNFDCDNSNVCVPHIDMPSTQHVKIHYNRPDATGFASYKNWGTWDNANNATVYFNGSDSFGKVLNVTLTNASRKTSYAFIVKTDAWDKDGCKNCDGLGEKADRTITLDKSGTTEVWVVSGADDQYYTSLSAAQAAGAVASPWEADAVDPNFDCVDGVCTPKTVVVYPSTQTLTVHYNRPAGDYADWNLWLWTSSISGSKHSFDAEQDAYGAKLTWEITDASKNAKFGFIVRTDNWVKDTNDDRFANVDPKGTGAIEIWLKQGDTTVYTSNPFPTPAAPVASPASAGYGQAVTVSGTGFDGVNKVTLVQTAVSAVSAVPAVYASKAPGSSVYKCGSVTKSSSTSVCVAAVPAKSAIPAATATAVARAISSTKVVIAFPSPAAALTGKLVVNNPAGSATSVGNFSLTKTKATATISSSTAKGLVGDTITVTGNNIGAATAVTLGTLVISNFTVTDIDSLTFKAPVGTIDSKVAVTTAGGTVTASKNFALIPSITSVDKTTVAIGGKLTITGVNLGAVSAVKLGEKSVTSFTKGATTVSFNVPSGSATGTVTLTAPGGEVTSVASVTVLPQPTVTNVTGTVVGSGATAKFKKGTTLTVTGTNFTGATSVKVGATSITGFSVVNDTTITFTAPTNKTGVVTVTTPGGSASSASISTTSS